MIFNQIFRQKEAEALSSEGGKAVASELERKRVDAPNLWSKGNNNSLKWPLQSVFVSEHQKLFYVPIAKCGCTSLKSMMVRQAEIPHAERAIDMGVHWVTDNFNTGVRLKDFPLGKAQEIIASTDYLKFAVIRNPLDRILSAYLEKFVFKRHAIGNHRHTRAVFSAVQQCEDMDLDKGISFDGFISYIVSQPPESLDPHWRPQYLYFSGMQIDEIYRLDDLEKLTQRLQDYLKKPVDLEHSNRIAKSGTWLRNGGELNSAEIEVAGSIEPKSLLSSDTKRAIEAFFARDFDLFNSTL